VKKWFEVKMQADGTTAEISVFGMIGDFIDDMLGLLDGMTTAKSFTDALAALPPTVRAIKVRINSPGGDAFGGITIANALRAELANGRDVETIVEGLAASAASLVAMGGRRVVMADNAMMMVHAPWSVAMGNASELRAVADQLDQIRDAIAKTYQWHSELSDEEILALVNGKDGQGTWLDADEAIAAGLATEKLEGLRAAASISRGAIARLHVPERFQARVAELTAAETEQEPPVAAPAGDPAPPPVELPAPAATEDPSDEPPPAAPAAQARALAVPPPPVAAAALPDIFAACREAGLDADFIAQLNSNPPALAELPRLVAAEKGRRVSEDARQQGIRDLCARFKVNQLVPHLIGGGTSLEGAQALVAAVTAMVDVAEIDAGLTPAAATGGSKPVIDVKAIYEGRKNPTRH
jgi:ATP-dependent protease ClpP protease subunit